MAGTKNTDSTRYYSTIQENAVAKKLGGTPVPSSGSGKFNKSDVSIQEASLLVECKTSLADKDSFIIKKDWISKLKQEAYSTGYQNNAVAIRFGPYQEDYFIINEAMMTFLVEKLTEDLK